MKTFLKYTATAVALTASFATAVNATPKNNNNPNVGVEVDVDVDNYNKNYLHNYNHVDVDVDVDVDNSNNNTNKNIAHGGDAHATGGNAAAIAGANADADANATIGDTTSVATVGNTTAQNGDQSQNLSITNTEAPTAYAPTAVAGANSAVTCGRSIGLSAGYGNVAEAFSAGVNFPMGVNQTCMTYERAKVIISTGGAIYGHNQAAGADLIATSIAVMMQEDEAVDSGVKFVASQNCTSGNAIDRFRLDCGGYVAAAPAPVARVAAPALK